MGPFNGFYLNFIFVLVFGDPHDSLVPNHGTLSFWKLLNVVTLMLVRSTSFVWFSVVLSPRFSYSEA